MNKFVLIGVCICLSFASTAHQSSESELVQRVINVNGKGSIFTTPDLFNFSLYIEEKGELVSKLNASVSRKSQQIVSLLLKNEVAERDIQSMRVDLNPWYEHIQNSRVQKGFILSRKINVTLRKMDKYDQLIDGLLRMGAGRIEGFKYQVEDPEQDYLKALDLAVADALVRAKKIAAALGVKVGDVISVHEASGYTPMPRARESMVMADTGGYLPGQISTSAQVNIVFTLE